MRLPSTAFERLNMYGKWEHVRLAVLGRHDQRSKVCEVDYLDIYTLFPHQRSKDTTSKGGKEPSADREVVSAP